MTAAPRATTLSSQTDHDPPPPPPSPARGPLAVHPDTLSPPGRNLDLDLDGPGLTGELPPGDRCLLSNPHQRGVRGAPKGRQSRQETNRLQAAALAGAVPAEQQA